MRQHDLIEWQGGILEVVMVPRRNGHGTYGLCLNVIEDFDGHLYHWFQFPYFLIKASR